MGHETVYITFMNGPADGRSESIHKELATIGSDPDNDVKIDFDPSVANRHIEIKKNDAHWEIQDVSDGPGVFMNGGRIYAANTLKSTQLVTLGATLLKIEII